MDMGTRLHICDRLWEKVTQKFVTAFFVPNASTFRAAYEDADPTFIAFF